MMIISLTAESIAKQYNHKPRLFNPFTMFKENLRK